LYCTVISFHSAHFGLLIFSFPSPPSTPPIAKHTAFLIIFTYKQRNHHSFRFHAHAITVLRMKTHFSLAALTPSEPRTPSIPKEVLEALAQFVSELRFGSIEIVVHEGRITQIERREKLRFG
jgi:hypothetical protein